MAVNNHPKKQNSNILSPLSPLSVNLHHHSAKRQETIDLFSPKGRPIRRHSVPHRRNDARGAATTPVTPCSSPIHSNKKPTHESVNKTVVVPMMLRLRRMKRRLLQEHTKGQELVSSPTNRNL